MHQAEVHNKDKDKDITVVQDARKSTNTVGSRIGRPKVRKLVIKSKSTLEIKSENNFDSIFSNKLKTEEKSETMPIGDEKPVLKLKHHCKICDKSLPNLK